MHKLTNEELVYLYQNGDEEALEKLIEKNKRMVFKLVNGYYTGHSNSIDKEDLEQEGFIGLMVAVDKYKFDHEKPCSFIAYAVYWINQKINRFINQRNTNNEISLNVPLNDDGDITYLDMIEDSCNVYENVEDKIYNKQLRDELKEVMAKYNTLREREILKLRYGWDNKRVMSYKEIGKIFNVSDTMIMNNENTALRKIRRSSWGIKKAREIYGEKFILSKYDMHVTEEKIDFAQKYLIGGSYD